VYVLGCYNDMPAHVVWTPMHGSITRSHVQSQTPETPHGREAPTRPTRHQAAAHPTTPAQKPPCLPRKSHHRHHYSTSHQSPVQSSSRLRRHPLGIPFFSATPLTPLTPFTMGLLFVPSPTPQSILRGPVPWHHPRIWLFGRGEARCLICGKTSTPGCFPDGPKKNSMIRTGVSPPLLRVRRGVLESLRGTGWMSGDVLFLTLRSEELKREEVTKAVKVPMNNAFDLGDGRGRPGVVLWDEP